MAIKTSEETMKRYDNAIEQVKRTMAVYIKQFASLSQLINQMDNMSNYLTQKFNPKS